MTFVNKFSLLSLSINIQVAFLYKKLTRYYSDNLILTLFIVHILIITLTRLLEKSSTLVIWLNAKNDKV